MYQFESQFWQKECLCAGIDEAGRGPIAGPLVVAIVVLPINYQNEAINDSKKLSETKRKKIFHQIIKDALYYHIKVVNVREIDTLNIYQATKKAMIELALTFNIENILTDAMDLDIEKNVLSIIKGDAKSISIAAASILAKVYRDNLMLCLDYHYPEYLLAKHKGYPTKKHLELIQQNGVNDIYRKSYQPVKNIIDRNI